MTRSPLSISNIVLSHCEGEAVDAAPKASFYRDALLPNPVPVLLRVRRVRVVATALCLASALAGVTFVLARGVTLATIHDASQISTQSQRETLVQDYNAYVSAVAALSVKPLQVLTATILPVWLWCFLTETVMAAESSGSRKTKMVVLSVTVALLWLLSNTFYGINVQLVYENQHSEVATAMSSTDIVHASDFVQRREPSTPSDDSSSALNSVLRSAITMDYRPARSACSRPSPQRLVASIEYGFASRDWMKQLASSLPAVIGTEAETRLGALPSEEATQLPMEASAARSLATYAIPLMREFFLSSSEKSSATANMSAIIQGVSTSNSTNLLTNINASLLQFVATSASTRLKWFDTSNVNVSFAAKNLSDGMVYESLRFEIPFQSSYMQRRLTLVNNDTTSSVSYSHTQPSNSSGTSSVDYFCDINIKEECGEHACLVSPRGEPATDAPVDSGVQMRVLPICLHDDGTEDLAATLEIQARSVACHAVSNSSFLVFSFAQRVEGESLSQSSSTGIVRLKNAKKYYSVTIGRLRWNSSDLAQTLGGSCAAGSDCSGVFLRLKENTLITASSTALPLQDLLKTTSAVSTWTTLVASIAHEIDAGGSLKGSLILPALFSTSSTLSVAPAQCEVQRGNLLASIEKNYWVSHRSDYHTLTAALFWLFQDGVVKTADSTGSSSGASGSTSGSSAAETRTLPDPTAVARLVVQVPQLSAMLSYCGCAVVLLLSVSVLLFSKRHESRIEKNFTPLHLAQMLVGASSAWVPSRSLLRSDLLRIGGDLLSSSDQLSEFEIVSLTLRHRQSTATLIQVPQAASLSASGSTSSSAFGQV